PLETVWCFTPVASLVTVTCAPGTTAPEGSVTVPWMVPVPASWPKAWGRKNRPTAIASPSTRRRRAGGRGFVCIICLTSKKFCGSVRLRGTRGGLTSVRMGKIIGDGRDACQGTAPCGHTACGDVAKKIALTGRKLSICVSGLDFRLLPAVPSGRAARQMDDMIVEPGRSQLSAARVARAGRDGRHPAFAILRGQTVWFLDANGERC